METYTVGDIAPLFDVSEQTIRRWGSEFSDYLSHTSQPDSGTTRLYSEEDLTVFALVSEYKKASRKFSDIHAALANGQRGEIPKLDALTIADARNKLELQIQSLQGENAEQRDKIARLETEVLLLREQLTKAEQKSDRDDLLIQIGELRAKLAALESKG